MHLFKYSLQYNVLQINSFIDDIIGPLKLMLNRKKLTNLVYIPKIFDECYLCFIQIPDHIQFPIKRVYYILKRYSKMPRGYHAHKKTKQILFCIQGRITIILDDGKQREAVILDKPELGIIIKNKIWHEMHNFKKNTIILVLTSEIYDPNDYIRDYEEFLIYLKKNESD